MTCRSGVVSVAIVVRTARTTASVLTPEPNTLRARTGWSGRVLYARCVCALCMRGWWGPGAAARGARVRDQACAVSGACNAWFVASQRSKTVREGRAQCAGCTLLGGVPCGGHVTLACVPAAHQNGVRGYPSLQSVIAHPCMRIGCPCAGLVLRMLVVA